MNITEFERLVSQVDKSMRVFVIDYEDSGKPVTAHHIQYVPKGHCFYIGYGSGKQLTIRDILNALNPPTQFKGIAYPPYLFVAYDGDLFNIQPGQMSIEFDQKSPFLMFNVTQAERIVV